MIALIKGEVFEIADDNLIILASGVGYRVYTPISSYEALPQIGEDITLYTHYHVREDAALLFGFETKKQLALFELLINVNGVGTKTALIMLNTLSYDQLLQSMKTGSVNNLVKVPGIGKKTAERILLEMKDKIGKLEPAQVFKEENSVPDPGKSSDFNDKSTAVTALVQLGYSAALATNFVDRAAEALPQNTTIEQLITAALRIAAKG
ncbi:MAG: Holliday junction branch migration protein RuvA [Bacillota bacterium]|jgi:Holliday junction DNA helicase RuvA